MDTTPDLSHLSPTAQAAIASCGSECDLQLRTTLRRDDVHVTTAWMPCDRAYETLVEAPRDVLDALLLARIPYVSQYATKAEAETGHRQAVTRVGMLLQARKAGEA